MYTEKQNESLVSQDRLIRLHEVLELIPVSRSTWYNGVKSGIYPKSIKIGLRAVAWRSSEIQSIIQSLR